MKKTTLKTGIGSGKNAAKFLGAAFCAITLTLAYSCSADGEYEEPWLNKEFRTRAVSENESIEHDLGIFIGDSISWTYNTNSELSLTVTVGWADGRPGFPQTQPKLSWDWERTDPSYYYVIISPNCHWLDTTEGAVTVEFSFQYKLLHDITSWNGDIISQQLLSGTIHEIKDVDMHYSNR